MDKIPVAQVKDFKEFLISNFRDQHPEILKEIREKKEMISEDKVRQYCTELGEIFLRNRKQG